MIRLILLIIGIFLLWVLFLSGFSKRKKVIICVAALIVSIASFWFEQSGQRLKDIAVSELIDCGVMAEHSYRTNYDIQFCLQNSSTSTTIKRIEVNFVALNCQAGNCQQVQAVYKQVPLSLAPLASITLKENLNFDLIDPAMKEIVWSAEVLSAKAIF